tara:strand:- start:1002 stop:1625 length:624 start_codon:yes stop_codon:yes gene_type:complete
MANKPEFIYFDLGNVLLHFSRERQFRQMAQVLGITAEEIAQLVEKHDLLHLCETGKMTPPEAHELLCEEASSRCDFHSLFVASSDIFEINLPMLPLITQLRRHGYRMGILSNTSANHWNFCLEHFSILQDYFQETILSYEVGAMKPEKEIYAVAIEAAGVPAEKIFYADDLQPNVDGALSCNMDAVLYTETPPLVNCMRQRGVQFAL